MKRMLIALCVASGMACGGDDAPASEGAELPAVEGFAAELNIDFSRMTDLGGGLYMEDLREGTGDMVRRGQVIVAHYTGWLPDGTKFESSKDSGRPFASPVGVGSLITGWDLGIPGMKVGGVRKLVIPPNLGYGAAGSPPNSPPNTTLVVEVEVLEVQ